MSKQRKLAIETDTKLSEIYGARNKVEGTIYHLHEMAHAMAGDKQTGRHRTWLMTNQEVIEALEQKRGDRAVDRLFTRMDEATKEGERLDDEAAKLIHVYNTNGQWNRYFLVANDNGHIHRGMDCSTCFRTTRYNWLIDLADCDEAEMVAQFGEMACTVCFPDAPTMKGFGDGTSQIAVLSAAEKDAKDAEKAARKVAKDAKAITQPDGQPLREEGWKTGEPGKGPIIKTERAAGIALTDCLQNVLVFGYEADRYMPQANYLAEALAHKQGKTVEDVMKAHEQKARKRK